MAPKQKLRDRVILENHVQEFYVHDRGHRIPCLSHKLIFFSCINSYSFFCTNLYSSLAYTRIHFLYKLIFSFCINSYIFLHKLIRTHILSTLLYPITFLFPCHVYLPKPLAGGMLFLEAFVLARREALLPNMSLGFTCIYVLCVHTCMYMHAHIRRSVAEHVVGVHLHICIMCAYMYMHARHMCLRGETYMSFGIHMRMYVCMYACVRTYIYIYIYIYIYMYKYMYIYI